MSNFELFMAGIKLMVFGMGMVYAFLVIMIYSMKLLEKVLKPFAAKFEPQPAPQRKTSAKPSGDDSQLAAAAATALHKALSSNAAIPRSTAASGATAANAAGKTHKVSAPLPGSVVKILSKNGDTVEANDVVLILESMKMETEIRAVAKGIIQSLDVAKGAVVASGDALFEIVEKQA